jgi:hypothetical protein
MSHIPQMSHDIYDMHDNAIDPTCALNVMIVTNAIYAKVSSIP